jgi:ABC-2 type transport system permease protein
MPGPLPALWRKEGRVLSRDRFGLATLFLMPAIFILLMSLALRDAYSTTAPSLRYTVVDLDGTPASRELAGLLKGTGFAYDPAPGTEAAAGRVPGTEAAAGRDPGTEAAAGRDPGTEAAAGRDPGTEAAAGRVPGTEAAAGRALATGSLSFAVRIPAGFEDRLLETPGGPPLVTVRLDPAVAAMARTAFRQHLLGALGALQARTFMRTMAPTADAGALTPGRMEAVVSEEAVGSERPPSSVQQNVPAWLIFGMFFVVLPLSAIFITERQHGTLQRQLSLGLGPGTLLLGKLVPFMGVNLVQTLLMLGVGVWLVPLCGGEALALPRALWPPMAAMALALSLAAVSWALLVATLVRTTEQATILGGVGNILMAALGGIMVPRFVMPAGMRAVARLSPMAWGLDGFHAVMLRHGGWHGLLPHAARLVVFAGAALALAILLSRKGASRA